MKKLIRRIKLWKERQIKSVRNNVKDSIVQKSLIEKIENNFTNKGLNYGRKLYLIQNSIYGVDIQSIATEIARLRFFISLLVNESVDKEKPNSNIEPLPNLDFKIMQGDSLVSKFMGINLDKDYKSVKLEKESRLELFSENEDLDKLIDDFYQKKGEFQNESDGGKKSKLKEGIHDLIVKIFRTQLNKVIKDEKNLIKKNEPKIKKINSPINLKESEIKFREFSEGDKNKSFFAWTLYFAEVFQGNNPGFDIVIGNPPYVRQESITDRKEDLKKEYEVYNGTSDLYAYFYEKGISLLKEGGVMTYITSNKWLRAKYGENLRKFFIEKTNLKEIINF